MNISFSFSYILSQIFIILSYVFLLITYQVKDRKKILLFNFISLITSGLSYTFLNAYTGLAMIIVSIIRNIIFMFDNKKSNGIISYHIISLCLVYSISIIFAIFTYDGILSLMSVFATMMYTYSIWQKNPRVYKYLGILIEIIWIIYNIYIKSIFGLILEIILFISVIVGLVKSFSKNKKTT